MEINVLEASSNTKREIRTLRQSVLAPFSRESDFFSWNKVLANGNGDKDEERMRETIGFRIWWNKLQSNCSSAFDDSNLYLGTFMKVNESISALHGVRNSDCRTGVLQDLEYPFPSTSDPSSTRNRDE